MNRMVKKMNNNYLYFTIYKNIEKEVIELSNNIFFDDNQLDVYSINISDLILRCAVEIENISKELYFKLDGEEKRGLKYDYDCIKLIDNRWKINKKVITKINKNFHFSLNDIQPFDDAIKNSWNSAYQSIKHERTSAIKTTEYNGESISPQATIRNLINILSALYLLNIYYMNFEELTVIDNIVYLPIKTSPLLFIGDWHINGYDLSELDLSFGSKIFQVSCLNGSGAKMMSGNYFIDVIKGDKDSCVSFPVFIEREFTDEEKNRMYNYIVKEIDNEVRRRGKSMRSSPEDLIGQLANLYK